MNQKDDDLSVLIEVCKEKENRVRDHHHLEEPNDAFLESKSKISLISETTSVMSDRKTHVDYLEAKNDSNGDDWVLAPLGTLLLPASEPELLGEVTSQSEIGATSPSASVSSIPILPAEDATKTNEKHRQQASSDGGNSSSSGPRRPSPSRVTRSNGSRCATPTGRPNLPPSVKPSRSSTPTSNQPSGRPDSARSSTPTARPSMPNSSKSSTSKSSTPAHQTSASKKSALSRGISPSVKTRNLKNFSETNDCSPNLKPLFPERPLSTSKGRSSVPLVKPSSVRVNNGRNSRMSSCSPLRGTVSSSSMNKSTTYGVARSRWDANRSVEDADDDDVNPILMGVMMVERVVNMRKLAPPKQDDDLFDHGNISGKTLSSQEKSGFGRSLSKKSFEMALRHMDIRRSMPGNLRAMVTNVPASSVCSVRTESTSTRPLLRTLPRP